ncbi:MAG: type II toxin-antitoxin system YafQ family toxin [Bacteroidales bacterium]|nr:type II toxin-antitoxin system YafQ family toxin [Bacteroidales bacterium]
MNRPQTLLTLKRVLQSLANGEPLGKEFKAHKLSGSYKGFFECHIENDYLLIWMDEAQRIYVVRVGSHAEVLRM